MTVSVYPPPASVVPPAEAAPRQGGGGITTSKDQQGPQGEQGPPGEGGGAGPLPVVPPTLATTGTWVNKGAANVVTIGDAEIFKAPAESGTHMLLVPTPATPFRVTFTLLLWSASGAATTDLGLCFRESATGKIVAHFVRGDKAVQINKYSALNTWQSSPVTVSLNSGGWCPNLMYLRLRADGTTLWYEYSMDGYEFLTAFTEAKGAYFTAAPNQYGYFCDSSGVMQATVLSVLVE